MRWKAIILCIVLTNCAYNPVVDSVGRSGTFNISKSDNITNDIILCKKVASDNVSYPVDVIKFGFKKYVEIGTLGLIKADEMETTKVTRKCLNNRGHSVLN